MSRTVRLPAQEDLAVARKLVAAHLRPTPMVRASELGPDVWLKLETAQPTGAFKVRGALAALSALPSGERAVTPSAGNHGLGMAWAARRLGRQVTIVVAETASVAKVEALRALGADLVVHGSSYDEAEAHALTLPGTFVSGYNDPHVIAGQATIGPELDDPAGPLARNRPSRDGMAPTVRGGGAAGPLAGPRGPRPQGTRARRLCVVAPAGGGGLTSGLCLWATARGEARVVAAESDCSRALSAAVAAGRRVAVEVGETLADGLAGNLEPGSATVTGAAEATFVAVGEADLRRAIRTLAARHGLVVEGAAAVAYAALATGAAAAARAAAEERGAAEDRGAAEARAAEERGAAAMAGAAEDRGAAEARTAEERGAAAMARAAEERGAVVPRADERTVVVLTGRNIALPVLADVLAEDR